MNIEMYQRVFAEANRNHFKNELGMIKFIEPEKAEQVGIIHNGKPLRSHAFFDIDELAIGLPKDTNTEEDKTKARILHEMVHYFLWTKYANGLKTHQIGMRLFAKIDHSTEFMRILMKLFKAEFSAEMAKERYEGHKFIDYWNAPYNKVKYFKDIVPFET